MLLGKVPSSHIKCFGFLLIYVFDLVLSGLERV